MYLTIINILNNYKNICYKLCCKISNRSVSFYAKYIVQIIFYRVYLNRRSLIRRIQEI